MKVAILGSQGMLGHILSEYLKTQNHQVIDIARGYPCNFICDVEIQEELDQLIKSLISLKVEVVANCIGVLIKTSADNPARAIYVNSYLPHYLEQKLYNTPIKLIHISTDCVFDGALGNYTEDDTPSETNWYGRTKTMGEIINQKDLTIRTSIIGTELKKNGSGLLEWVLRQTEPIKGYCRAYWNGMTTLELSKFINAVITQKKELSGLYQVTSPEEISKFDLIRLICQVWNKRIELLDETETKIDKTLINNRKKEFYYEVSDYLIQLDELYNFTLKK